MTKGADKKAGANAVQALSPFRYTEELGLLVRGQVFNLGGYANDNLLLDMDYVRRVKRGAALRECGECGATFMDDRALEKHGQHFHDNWCDCDWTPPAGTHDKDRAMAEHIKNCRVWRDEKDRAATGRLKKIDDHKRAVAVAVS